MKRTLFIAHAKDNLQEETKETPRYIFIDSIESVEVMPAYSEHKIKIVTCSGKIHFARESIQEWLHAFEQYTKEN